MGECATETKTALFPVGFRFEVFKSGIIGTVVTEPFEVDYYGKSTVYGVMYNDLSSNYKYSYTVFEDTIKGNLACGAYVAL